MPANLQSIMEIEVPVIVLVATRTMTVSSVTGLVPGAIIELPKQADEELDILISNKQIGTGKAVKVGENFGVRIAYIGDLKERIEALAAETPPPAADVAEEEPTEADMESLADQILSSQ
jgi:flagellar motor switch protein FliN/FliY